MLSSYCAPTAVSAAVSSQIDSETRQVNSSIRSQNALASFQNMQDQITATLGEDGNKYTYNEDTIRNIVYSFDFSELRENTDLDYDANTFFTQAMNNIKETKLIKISPKGGNKYNVNKYEEGWNYAKMWMDENNTKKKIHELNSTAADLGLGGTIGGAVGKGLITGALGTILVVMAGLGVAVEAWLLNNVARNLGNVRNGTGTVLDINRFTAYYNCWSQDKYPG